MSVEDYARLCIDELFDVGPKSNSVSTLGSCYSAHADFSNWTKVQPLAAAPAHRLAKPDTDDTKQGRGDIRPILSACRTGLQMKHQNDARAASGLSPGGDLICARCLASRLSPSLF